ncbi:hypothetical protein Naga_100678g4 [Nannochloropsis gaditana]|uniref:Uncharacterized protein n=1 Tax=Nannochloropsis gaditana TaxID=72520 RepID=W7TC04_9STRA|nr:hypothetical protein Naga_100678g4 [Nannochloropsis gaditana]
MARNYSLGVLLAVAALASPFTQAHSTLRIDEGVKQTVTSPIDALSATMPNPVHTWEDKKTGTYYAQNQIFLKNTDATRAVCDVKFTVPVDAAAKTRVESSYVSHVETSRSGLDGSLPEYADKIFPNETVNLGYLISGPEAKAVEMGDFKVTSAEWCD